MSKSLTLMYTLGMMLCCAISVTSCGDEPSAAKPAAPGTQAAVKSVWLTDMTEAKRQAVTQKLPILADFTGSDWCHWCQKLDEEVFDTAAFASWAASHVILLKLDFPRGGAQSEALKQQNAQLAQHYQIEGYPTILFLDATGEIIGKTGYGAGGAEAWTRQAEGLLKR